MSRYFKKFFVYRIAYDLIASICALAFAFLTRGLYEALTEPFSRRSVRILTGYVDHFIQYSPVTATITLAVFATFGFYKYNKSKNRWSPIIYIGISLLPTLILSMLLYFKAPAPQFPRGAMLFLLFYNVIFLAFPRIVKYFIEEDLKRPKHLSGKNPKNALVIGGAGYIGAQLSADLLERGYNVRVLDSMIFGGEPINHIKDHSNFELVVGDFRNVETLMTAMKNRDVVIHLAGIVGDPACSIDDDFTIDVNLTATSMIAEVCKTLGVERMIFASTCSVYGQGQPGKPLSETSELNPVSLYARTKIASEKVLLDMTQNHFQPTILRFATLFGLSPRPRFDLAVNILSARAAKFGKINVFGGNQWRPFVHVKDVSKAIVAIIEAPVSKVGGEIFNIGSDKENHKIIDVGKMVADLIPGTELVVDETKEDNRNYFVSFEKLKSKIGVDLDRSVAFGIEEISEAVRSGLIDDISAPAYSNVKATEKVLNEIVQPMRKNSHHKSSPKALLKNV